MTTTQNQAASAIKSQNNQLSVQTELQQQMIELQMNMAHLELTVERLDQVITRQDKHIRTLQRQLQLVYKQVEGQSSDDGIAAFDVVADRPPHY
ncbi:MULTISPECIES: SlyX family protein [Psychrobacter]|uniref:SlyX family protein n=1 Tax=Psychrobacter TaxID=497 RepID=UPI001919E06C|nr:MULTISPECIES: SlyX family protein [Psychrobacter]